MKREISFFVTFLILELVMMSRTSFSEGPKNVDEAFMKAVYAGNIPLMQELLKDGADINATDKDGLLTPLAVAAAEGNIRGVDFLIAEGANPQGVPVSPNLPIFMAIGHNRVKVVRRFLDLGISPDYAWPKRDGGTLLIVAIQFGHDEIVRLLVGRGADVNLRGNGDYSPLYRSIIYDHFSIFKYLVDRGACLNSSDRTALARLRWETVEKNKKFAEYLKKNKKCRNQRERP